MSFSIRPNQYFKLENGVILKNIIEIPSVLEKMDEFTFLRYVNEHKNDFAKWIYDVFKDIELSKLIGKIKSKEEIIRLINAYIKHKSTNLIMRNANEISINKVQEQVQDKNKNIVSGGLTVQMNNQLNKIQTNQSEQKSQQIVQAPLQKPEQKQVNTPSLGPQVQTNQSLVSSNIDDQTNNQQTNDPDKYFEENPIIISQEIKLRQKNLELEKLVLLNLTGYESEDEIISKFKDTYMKCYERLVLLRKNGFDTELVQVMLFRIPAKIKLYVVERTEQVKVTIKRYLNEVIEELNSVNN